MHGSLAFQKCSKCVGKFQSTSGMPKWLLRFCQGIFKTMNSISTLEVPWLGIVANKTMKPTTSSSVLLICEFLDIIDLDPKVENEGRFK